MADPGTGDLASRLTGIVQALTGFYRASYPIAASTLGDRELFDRYAGGHRDRGTGPHAAWQWVHHYLVSERETGRIPAGSDLEMIALQLAGACQNAVWIDMVTGQAQLPQGGQDFCERLARSCLAAVEGRPTNRIA